MGTVLLYGTSANPPTHDGGHRGLARWAACRPHHPELPGAVEALWVVPVFRHVFDAKSDLAPFHHRLAMAELAFSAIEGRIPVYVSDVERTVAEARGGGRPGTLDLVEALEATHPDTRFALLLGADTARDLLDGRWQRSEALLARIGVVVVPRPGEPFDGRGRLRAAADAPTLAPVSSTSARAAAARADREGLLRCVSPAVADYILAHGLYGSGDGEHGREPV